MKFSSKPKPTTKPVTQAPLKRPTWGHFDKGRGGRSFGFPSSQSGSWDDNVYAHYRGRSMEWYSTFGDDVGS